MKTQSTIWRAEQTALDEFDLIEIQDFRFAYSGLLKLDISARGTTRRFQIDFPHVWAFDFTDEFFDAMSGRQRQRGQFQGQGKIYRADATDRITHFSEGVQPSFAEHSVDLAEFYVASMSSSAAVVCQGGYEVSEIVP